MFSKPRKPISLQILETLKKRKPLSVHEKASYQRLSSGFQGEEEFATLLKEKWPNPCLQLFGINLIVNGSECQLDCILIFKHDIFLLEIKNFQGDFFFKNDSLYLVRNTKEIKNPLHQLKRAEILLNEFLTVRHHQNFTIKPYLIFINPEFHCYQAPHNLPIIYPGQLNRFIHSLHNFSFDTQIQQKNIADQLIAAHISKSNYEQLPSYEYHQLKKGIVCHQCNNMMGVGNSKRRLICRQCQTEESVESAIMQNILEFSLLFPNEKVTVSTIENWSNYTIHKNRIRKILQHNLQMTGNGKGTYYVKRRV